MKDLPNMGEQDRGIPPPKPVTTVKAKTNLGLGLTGRPATTPRAQPQPAGVPPKPHAVQGRPEDPAPVLGWAASWKQTIWDKWRWGILIAFAVMVSRLSS